MKTFPLKRHIRKLLAGLSLAAIMTCASTIAVGQNKGRRRSGLPRVSKIEFPEDVTRYITGGCDYHLLHLSNTSADADIFVSNADGLLAMMNLDGKDVRLELFKTTLWYQTGGNAFARHEYRSGKTWITVTFWQLSDYTTDYPARIVLRRGRAARTIRAVGAPLCDAI